MQEIDGFSNRLSASLFLPKDLGGPLDEQAAGPKLDRSNSTSMKRALQQTTQRDPLSGHSVSVGVSPLASLEAMYRSCSDGIREF